MTRESLTTETHIDDEKTALAITCPFETDPTQCSFQATKQAISVR